MKIFLDSADRIQIKRCVITGLINGVTTNPSLLSKQDANTREVILEICSMVSGDVSVQVVEKDPESIYRQAKEIAALAKNIVVKIPFKVEYLPIIGRLTKEGISLNVTLVFSTLQALMSANLGVKYISLFIGRLDDIAGCWISLIESVIKIKKNYAFVSEVVVASVRSIDHWKQAAVIGADVISISPNIFEQAMNHPLTDAGVAKFDADWASLGKKNLFV